jgi:hypothetical protein
MIIQRAKGQLWLLHQVPGGRLGEIAIAFFASNPCAIKDGQILEELAARSTQQGAA